MSCASTVQVTDKIEKNETIINLVDSKKFEIKNEFVTPIAANGMISDIIAPRDNATNLSLDRNDSHFKIVNDSISVYLPFFGERRILTYGYSPSSHEGFIVYSGIPQKFKSYYDEATNEYRYDMRFRKNCEAFRIRLTIYGDGSTRIFLSSTNRSSLFYSGKVKLLEETS